ncbi:MAG: hypothetical protein BAA04_01030 [Firmicutes bacterium ZCTH02-B6]|nr:MAG: hypothetical protein BAA04_01030 [Firmicutes bacterium ZCTH02-B6]
MTAMTRAAGASESVERGRPDPHGRPSSPLTVAAAVSLSLLGDSLLYAVLPSQAAALGIPLVLVGVLLSVNRFVRFVTNSWAGAVYARRGRQRPFFLAMVGATLTTLAYAPPWGFWPFLLARALWGACFSFLRMGQMLAVLQSARTAERGRRLGQVQAVSRIGTVFALVVGGYLTDHLGYRFTIMLFGALTAVGAAIALRDWWTTRARPADVSGQHETSSSSAAIPAAAPGGLDPSDGTGAAAARDNRPDGHFNRQAAVIYVAGFAQGFAGFGLVMGTLSLLLLQRFGQQVAVPGGAVGVATLSGWLLGVRWVLELLLAPAGGRLSDRLGRHSTVLAGIALQAASLLVLARATSAGATVASACVLFAGLVVLAVSLDATAADLAARGRPTVLMSRYNTAQDLGAALGPSVGYTLGETIGLSGMYAGLAALLVVVAGLFVASFREAGRTPAARGLGAG